MPKQGGHEQAVIVGQALTTCSEQDFMSLLFHIPDLTLKPFWPILSLPKAVSIIDAICCVSLLSLNVKTCVRIVYCKHCLHCRQVELTQLHE